MTEVEAEVKKNLVVGEENEEESFFGDEQVEEKEEEEEEEEEEGEAVQVEKVQAIKPVKIRRCQRRKKVRKFLEFDEDDEEADLGLFPEDEEEEVGEEEEEEEEEDESDVSYTSSVLSAITFEWENGVYEFEELCDPGNIDTIYRKNFGPPQLVDDVGVNRYLEVCESLKINPTLRILQSLKRKEVDLSYCNLHGSSIRALCAALESNSAVQKLIMKHNRLTLDDCYYIGLILAINEVLYHLDFTGCRVGPQGVKSLIANMSNSEFIVDLNLSKCNIGDEGMKYLSYMLSRNNSIKNLDLSYNSLSDASAELLAVALKLNSSVTRLVLRYNNLFDPTSMKGFFRSLTFNRSISYLDLAWNGLSGVEMGGLIRNYLRRSASIEYLDLSSNRFEGAGALEIRKGFSKSRSLETFKFGKNPLSPDEMDYILSGADGCYKLKLLDLEDLWVKKSFLKILKRIQSSRDIEVRYAGVLSDYEVQGPDYAKVILLRAQFEAQKPKSEKKKKDFGHLMWTLGDEPITRDEFMTMVKKFKAKISKDLFPELMKEFTIPKVQLIDVVAMRNKYLSIFPDSIPPPNLRKKEVEPEAVPGAAEEPPAEAAAKPGEQQKKPEEVKEVFEEEEWEDEEEGEVDELEGEFFFDGESFEDEYEDVGEYEKDAEDEEETDYED